MSNNKRKVITGLAAIVLGCSPINKDKLNNLNIELGIPQYDSVQVDEYPLMVNQINETLEKCDLSYEKIPKRASLKEIYNLAVDRTNFKLERTFYEENLTDDLLCRLTDYMERSNYSYSINLSFYGNSLVSPSYMIRANKGGKNYVFSLGNNYKDAVSIAEHNLKGMVEGEEEKVLYKKEAKK